MSNTRTSSFLGYFFNHTTYSRDWFARVQFDYCQVAKVPNMHLALLNTGKAPHFDTVHYTDWAYQMKMHLILLHPRLWEIVYIGVVTFQVFVQQKIRTFKKISYNMWIM